MMRAGDMRHRIEIQNLSSGSWTHDGWQYAEITGKGASPWFARGVPNEAISHYVRTRYNQRLMARSRVLIPAHGTTLTAGISAVATSATIAAAFAGQSWPYYVRIEDEILYVTAGFGGTTLTVSRGQFGTVAAIHATSAAVIRTEVLNVGTVDVLKQVNEQMVAYCTDVSKLMEGLMTQTCTIQRMSLGTGPQPTETWATLSSSVPVRMQQASASEVNIPSEATVATWTAYFPFGTSITGRDRIVIGSVTYECLHENADPGGYGAYMSVACREVR